MMKAGAFAKDIIGVERGSIFVAAITGEKGIMDIIQVEIIARLRQLDLNPADAIESIMTDSGATSDADLVRPRFADLKRGVVQRRVIAKIVEDIILDQVVKAVDVKSAQRPISERIVQDLRVIRFNRRIDHIRPGSRLMPRLALWRLQIVGPRAIQHTVVAKH